MDERSGCVHVNSDCLYRLYRPIVGTLPPFSPAAPDFLDSKMAFAPAFRCLAVWSLMVGFIHSISSVEAADSADLSALEAQLEQRVEHDPSDAAGWRMLGHMRMLREDWAGALTALQTAVKLDPLGVAAFYDFGIVSRELGDEEQAAGALQRVIDLAPTSEYATTARPLLAELTASGVVPISYEIRSFDGSNDAPLIRDPRDDEETVHFIQTLKKDLDLRLDLGSQWNDNVSLTPSSRELHAGNLASTQGNASLSARYVAFRTDQFRLGPTLDVDYTLNEGNFDRLNLQSYRTGAFADAVIKFDDIEIKPRVAYSFTYDLFGGNTYGRRHTLATSVGCVWTPTQITTAYWSIDTNNIRNTGLVPSVTSQSGISNTLGVLHDYVRRDSKFRTFRVGADVSHVDAEGSNFRYNGASLYTQAVIVIVPQLHLTARGGWAYRDYYDFTLTPSRNTNIFRVGAELRKYFDHGLSAAIVSQYDDFHTQNLNFRSNRFLAGGQLSWEY